MIRSFFGRRSAAVVVVSRLVLRDTNQPFGATAADISSLYPVGEVADARWIAKLFLYFGGRIIVCGSVPGRAS